MRKSYIREKRTLCGDTYQAVGIYPVTDQEHRQRGKKRKESDRGQKSRNKAASLRRRQRKVLANFDQNGFYLTATYEDAYIVIPSSIGIAFATISTKLSGRSSALPTSLIAFLAAIVPNVTI